MLTLTTQNFSYKLTVLSLGKESGNYRVIYLFNSFFLYLFSLRIHLYINSWKLKLAFSNNFCLIRFFKKIIIRLVIYLFHLIYWFIYLFILIFFLIIFITQIHFLKIYLCILYFKNQRFI